MSTVLANLLIVGLMSLLLLGAISRLEKWLLRWRGAGTIISGNGSRTNDDIEKVTGRPPITFQDFARRNAHAWTLQAAK